MPSGGMNERAAPSTYTGREESIAETASVIPNSSYHVHEGSIQTQVPATMYRQDGSSQIHDGQANY